MTKLLHAHSAEPGALLTSSRIERKYFIDAAGAERLLSACADRLTPHHHAGTESDTARAQHFTTTVYFDTAGGCVRRAAERGGWHGKLRVREYYDVEPGSAGRHSDAVPACVSSALWLELKIRDGDRSSKHRLRVPRSAVPWLFEHGQPRFARIASCRESAWQPGDDSEQALQGWTRRLRGCLRPALVVNYRRQAWQNAEATVRVTLDQDVAVFRPRPVLWDGSLPWSRELLGTAVQYESRCVLEVKCIEQVPAWLELALPVAGLEPCSSKFVRGCRAIHASRR